MSGQKRPEKSPQPDISDLMCHAREAVLVCAPDGTITLMNPYAEQLFGYETGELIREPIAKLFPLLRETEEGISIDAFSIEGVRKDGTHADLSLTMSPIRDTAGNVTGALYMGLDMSASAQMQIAERDHFFLASIISSADDAIISKDLDGVVTSWNPGAERIFGYSASEMIGKPIAILIPSNQIDEEPRILEKIRRGERISHYETRRVRKDGTQIDVSLTVSPIKDSLGRVIGASKIARDISVQKQVAVREGEMLKEAQQLRRQADVARQHAEEASSAKDDFLAIVSHELRTPLTAILGWTRMLSAGTVGPENQKNAFEVLDRNARAQAQLIEDLLDVSRIISGKFRIEFKPVDFSSVIRGVLDTLLPATIARGIRIEQDIAEDAGAVTGDVGRLQQVVWNLLSNAIKFSPRNGVVRIQLQRAGSQVELRVSDNGIGINPEFLPHIFRRFSQADLSITRQNTGLGVGLAIVKSIIELHGGTVAAASNGEGKGSTFVVKLPIYAVQQSIGNRRDSRNARPFRQESGEDLVGLKILVVDDETDACNMLRFIFDQCGAIVETAQSVRSALEVFDRWHPDMLVSDIGMPALDGYELIRILRKDRQTRIPAIALTAMTRAEDRARSLTAGYQMHVPKPVEPNELISIASSLAAFVERPPPS